MRSPRQCRDIVICTTMSLLILCFAPDSFFAGFNVSWGLGWIVLPLFFITGLVSAALHYRRSGPPGPDPFAQRAEWSLFSGLVALPVVLLFRSSVAHLAFLIFLFGLGPVLGHRLYLRLRRQAPRA